MLGGYAGAFPILEYEHTCMKYTPVVNDMDSGL